MSDSNRLLRPAYASPNAISYSRCLFVVDSRTWKVARVAAGPGGDADPAAAVAHSRSGQHLAVTLKKTAFHGVCTSMLHSLFRDDLLCDSKIVVVREGRQVR